MKIFLRDSDYSDSLNLAQSLQNDLTEGKLDCFEAIEKYNSILKAVTVQKQVDAWKKQENNHILFHDMSSFTERTDNILKFCRFFIRDLITVRLDVSDTTRTMKLMIDSYIHYLNLSECHDKPNCVYDIADVRFSEVVKKGLQYLSSTYNFEVTVNYFVCNKLLEIKDRVSLKCVVENYLGDTISTYT